MPLVFECPWIDTVAVVENVAVEVFAQEVHLSAFFRFHEKAGLDRQIPERHYNKAGLVVAGASGDATETFSAVPNGVAFEEFFYLGVVLMLDYVHDPSWIVAVELRGRADRRASAAVYAGVETFLEPVILHQPVIQFSHSYCFFVGYLAASASRSMSLFMFSAILLSTLMKV